MASLVERESSAALQIGSLERLQLGFGRLVAAESTAPGWDPRDAMINLTPFIDCARRLGLDPATSLGPIARSGAGWYGEMFDRFVTRSDVTLEAFGWRVIDTADGLAYRFRWPS